MSVRGRRRIPPQWLPRQHGAWAMLIVPYLAGVERSHGDAIQVPLLVFWLVGYLAFSATALWLRSRRRPAYRRAVVVYAVLAALLGAPLAWVRPDLLVWVPVFVPLAAVSLGYAARRNERSLVNDGVTILAACLFGLVTYQAGYDPGGTIEVGWVSMVAIVVACLGYFFGTALYVKTLIRERTSAGYRVASVGYHAAVTAAWAALALLPGVRVGLPVRACVALTVFFAVLTLRAGVLAGRRIPPLRIGLGEIGACVALLAIVRFWDGI